MSTNTTTASTTNTTTSTEAADRTSLGYNNYKGEKKNEYNIAFFLPFHAEEANTIDLDKIIKGDAQFSNKTNVALQFYEGAMMAIDSLKKLNLNAKIFVYDVDDKDSLAIDNILKKPELGSMDLMIGPLYGSGFIPVANFAKEHSIAIVSPFTQINKILFANPYVSKVSPSVTMQVEQMAHFVVDSFKTQNIILVNNSNHKELPFFNAFKNSANADLLKAGMTTADSVRIGFGLGNTQSMLSTTKVNVIVLPSNNQSYVTEFISSMNTLKDKYKIVLFGLQNWMNYDNLDFEYLNKQELIRENKWKNEYEVYELETDKTEAELELLRQKIEDEEKLLTIEEKAIKKQNKKFIKENESIETFVYDNSGNLKDINVEIEELREGKFDIKIAKPRSFKAGKYTIKLDLVKDGIAYTQEQDFTWGVLAINLNKSIYLADEDSFISIGVLDDEGKIVCNADVTLEIINPLNQKTTLTTQNNEIKISEE